MTVTYKLQQGRKAGGARGGRRKAVKQVNASQPAGDDGDGQDKSYDYIIN